MGDCYDFREQKMELFVKKAVKDFYLYLWDLSSYFEVEFSVSASELSLVFARIYVIMKVENYDEFHEVLDLYVCYMLAECNEDINMRYMMKVFERNQEQLIQLLYQSRISIVKEEKGKVLSYG